ncbi:MAG: TIGR00159 family protein [Oscillatoriales cyanobacterium RM2_1_1]|nr:TIGR00159 family protein [Oscillatoriales cyanobacterium SM2_3_0]NJO45775.1 TIGR00159 family protein [Oscillatoriales cyanobacterium RM2_1_1]
MSLGSNSDPMWMQSWFVHAIDIGLVFAVAYIVLVIIGERRTLWMVRGFILLMLATAISNWAGLRLLYIALNSLVTGSAVAMAVMLQAEFRQFLEQLGRGEILQLFGQGRKAVPEPDNVIDQIVEAVKELSQNRIGALIVIETGSPIDERDFSVPGVKLNAEVSRELLQTIFQPKTLLHDGAVLIRASRITAAGVILPLSERMASRQLGTRHRAAMGMTERVRKCVCVVVSEETGSISLAEKGVLNRPLTSSKLKELLEARSFPSGEDRIKPSISLGGLKHQFQSRGRGLISRIFRLRSSASREKQ